MRTFSLCLMAVAAHAATTVYQASVDQLSVVHGAAAADSAIHHAAPQSLRVEPGGQYSDALVRSVPVSLAIGKRYELSAWVRTENLTVRDTGRSPIATGAVGSGAGGNSAISTGLPLAPLMRPGASSRTSSVTGPLNRVISQRPSAPLVPS